METTQGIGSRPRAIGVSCQGRSDAAFRVRLELPGRGLVDHGVDLDLLPLFPGEQARRFRAANPFGKARILAASRRQLKRELLARGEGASTVVVQRGVDLAPQLTLERAATRGRRLIYDVDDAVWLSGGQTGGHPLSGLKGAARRVRWLAEGAAHTIAGNEILAEHLAAYGGEVTVVPSLVDPADYVVKAHEQGEVVTLGWIGSPTTAPYLGRVAGALERFARDSERPVRLIAVGGTPPELAGVRVEERAWSPEAEGRALAEMDVGLMPLADTPWTRGKCAYKALQYMAAGIPPLADDVGVSAATVEGAGYAVSGAEGWREALEALAADATLRDRLGAAGRRRVEEEFSPARWLPTLAAIVGGE